MSAMRFDDDVVIITGAGRGLGREYALAFARRGAAVVVNDIGVEQDGAGGSTRVAQAVVDEIVAAGGRAVAESHSVTSQSDAEAVVQTALQAFGRVTALVNNAGIIDFATLENITEESWRRMIAVTLDGAFYMSKAVWPHFVGQKYGRLVNTTSNAGFGGNEMLVHYGAAKLGVAGFTKALAREAMGLDIKVNAVAPMAVTRMNRDAFFGGVDTADEDWRDLIRRGVAPIGPPSIVAPTVLWLSHASTDVNGDVYSVSSGKVSRVGFVVGEGYFNPDHGPEDLRDNSHRVRALDNYLDPTCTSDELAVIAPLFAQG